MPQTLASHRPSGATSATESGPDVRELVFENAYREHAEAVTGLARRLLGDRSLAEEVSQEVFLRLWRRPDRVDPSRGSLRAFLLAECRSRAVDAIRRESARRRREVREGRSKDRCAVADVASDVCEAAVREQVAGLVQTLPDRERDAICLAYSGHITYREVAVVLDTPEGTVKGRIRSGLRRLRSQMEERGLPAGTSGQGGHPGSFGYGHNGQQPVP